MEKETLHKALAEGDLNTLQDLLHDDIEYVLEEKFEVISMQEILLLMMPCSYCIRKRAQHCMWHVGVIKLKLLRS